MKSQILKFLQLCLLTTTVFLTEVNANQVKAQSNREFLVDPKPESTSQDGKLQLVNDTPYIALVLLYKPGMQQPNRYVNIPPCHARRLLNTYSDSWGLSVNKTTGMIRISNISSKNQDTFVIKTSSLNQNTSSKRTCRDKIKAKDVNNPDDYFSGIKYLFQLGKDLSYAISLKLIDDKEGFMKALEAVTANIKGATASIENLLSLSSYTEKANLQELLADNNMKNALRTVTEDNYQKLFARLPYLTRQKHSDASKLYNKLEPAQKTYFALLPKDTNPQLTNLTSMLNTSTLQAKSKPSNMTYQVSKSVLATSGVSQRKNVIKADKYASIAHTSIGFLSNWYPKAYKTQLIDFLLARGSSMFMNRLTSCTKKI